jgi:putative iron-regulated protein
MKFALYAILLPLCLYAQTPADSVRAYGELVQKGYREALQDARALQAAVRTFTDAPSVMTLEMAREAWRESRLSYNPTEAFRFYSGPIDGEGGPEGQLNAWPLDEAYIDGVVGAPNAGIINDVAAYPVLDRDLLMALNERDGESNISTGYHAIEFLLWGQDFYATSAGQRAPEDFTTAPNALRRAQYLQIVADILVDDLATLEAAWAPGADNYRRAFEALPTATALKHLLTGAVYLAGDELAGERLYVAYDTRGQEDEQSCFSDNTHMDILGNFLGVLNVVQGTRLLELPGLASTPVAARLEGRLQTLTLQILSIPVPFDQAIVDEAVGRPQILSVVTELEALAQDLVEASRLLGAPVEF